MGMFRILMWLQKHKLPNKACTWKQTQYLQSFFGNYYVGCWDNDVIREGRGRTFVHVWTAWPKRWYHKLFLSATELLPSQHNRRTNNQDLNMLEATKQRLERLDISEHVNRKTTSVDFERSLSAEISFSSKIRSRMNDNTLSALVSFKYYFF